MRWNWRLASEVAARDQLLSEALAGCYLGSAQRGPRLGGRTPALAALREYDLADYGRSRNHLDGPVSRLSPYLRHGMVTAVEVRDHLRKQYGSEPQRLEEFLRQLAWRDFFEKVLDWHGDALHDDIEDAKHGVERINLLPPEVASGRTGLPCIDGMLNELFTEGYLHNHERLWFAAYLCHFRGVTWQQGARLFRQYLYDGDVASNSSSWQWVEGTFASKPYFMNKENIATFSGRRWCDDCRVKCPFDASYEQLQHRLFAGNRAPLATNRPVAIQPDNPPETEVALAPDISATLHQTKHLIWIHDAALSPEDPAIKLNPGAALVFVFDKPQLRAEPWAFHRLAFVFDGVCDLFQTVPNPVQEVCVGDPVVEITQTAKVTGADTIHVTDHPNPRVRQTVEALKRRFSVVVHPRPVLAEYADEPRRFTRYWEKAAPQVLGYQPKGTKKFHK